MSPRDPCPKKKRTPRQAWEAAQRAAKRAIAQAARDVRESELDRARYDRPGEPAWNDMRGPRPVRIKIRESH